MDLSEATHQMQLSLSMQCLQRDWACDENNAITSLGNAQSDCLPASLTDNILHKLPVEMDGWKKRKGKAERERIKKRKALTTDTAKCCKISEIFASKGPGHTTYPAWLAK